MTTVRVSPWRGMHWLVLSAVAAWVMERFSALMLWAHEKHQRAREP